MNKLEFDLANRKFCFFIHLKEIIKDYEVIIEKFNLNTWQLNVSKINSNVSLKRQYDDDLFEKLASLYRQIETQNLVLFVEKGAIERYKKTIFYIHDNWEEDINFYHRYYINNFNYINYIYFSLEWYDFYTKMLFALFEEYAFISALTFKYLYFDMGAEDLKDGDNFIKLEKLIFSALDDIFEANFKKKKNDY